ncbi:MAG: spore coat protein U domain-containing protein [Thermoanaerobaculia bacterium]|nr:spore coat protein U domain-containing protein [Thermoanaerobaculia bacterium]
MRAEQIMSRPTYITAFALVAMLLGSGDGSAQSQQIGQVTGRIEVSAVVIPNCRIDLTPLSFGGYDPLGIHSTANLDATTTMILSCTRNSQATIVMDDGRSGLPDGSSRGLVLTDQRLGYQIYSDSQRTQVWGKGARGVSMAATGVGAQRLTLYGRILPAQQVAAGTYVDVVTATVDF